jgi:hypothetical protein
VTGEPDEWTEDDHGAYTGDGSGGPGDRSVSGSDGLTLLILAVLRTLSLPLNKKPKNAISAGH